jgi:hypothetical protein
MPLLPSLSRRPLPPLCCLPYLRLLAMAVIKGSEEGRGGEHVLVGVGPYLFEPAVEAVL